MNRSKMMNIDTGEKTWITPIEIINSLGDFDLDPCCPNSMPWRTAKQMICQPDDGLKADWSNKRIWLNPPYGRDAIPFLIKMAANTRRLGSSGYAFLFCRTDTIAWHTLIFPYAYGMLFMKGRVKFCKEDGTQSESAPAPSVIVAYTKKDYDMLRESGIKGSFAVIEH